jgi:hypothetical protein
MTALQQRLEAGDLTYAQWWQTVSRMKGLEQWKNKVNALGCEDGVSDQWSFMEIGSNISRHLHDGGWNSQPLGPALM